MPDDGVAFLPELINAKQAYSTLPTQTGTPEFTLNWAPIFGDVSARGDLGYSTGPVVKSDNTKQDRPAQHSLYFSVWKKQANGDWRVVVDLGVKLDRAYAPLHAPYQRAPQWKARIPNGEDHAASLLKAERDFFESAASHSRRGFSPALRPPFSPAQTALMNLCAAGAEHRRPPAPAA